MSSQIDVIMRLTDQVTAPLARIRNQMEQTAKINARVSRSVKNIGKQVSDVGNSLLPLSAGIVAAGAASAKAFVGFDATMVAAGAKAGATATELQAMREAATKLGTDFPISASQAAAGMENLAAAGFNAKETIGAMPAIVKAAVASGEDLAVTSSVVTSALNVWDLKQGDIAKNTERVADVIQQAANASSMNMQDFGVALQYVGAPAAALKVDIENVATALAIIKNKGIDASTAGTSLRAMFTRLARPPKEAANTIAALGLQVKDAQGNFVGMESIVNQMRTSMAGLSDTERIAHAQAIAGTEGYSALLALIDTAPAEYKKMSDAMNSAAGSSTKQFGIMKNTVKGSIDAMMGSTESLAINFGSVLAPSIRQAADVIGTVANAINSLSPENKQLIANIAMGIVGFTGFALIAGKVIGVVGSMIGVYSQIGIVMAGGSIKNKLLQYSIIGCMKAFTLMKAAALSSLPAIGSAFTFLMFPVSLAIMAVVAAGYLLYRNWDYIKAMLISVVASIQQGFATYCEMWKNVLSGVIDFVAGIFTGDWERAWSGLLGIVESISNGMTAIFGGTIDSIRGLINGLIDGFNGIQINIPSWVPGFGGQTFGPLGIPHLATGTDSWSGGPAMIHDRGAEIVDLPSGSRVIPHDKSIQTAYAQGQVDARTNDFGGINVTISNVNVYNDNDIDVLAYKVASKINTALAQRAINMNKGVPA